MYLQESIPGAMYTHCYWEDFTMFMPYEQLDFTKGTLKNEALRLDLGVWDNSAGKILGSVKTYNFNVTY